MADTPSAVSKLHDAITAFRKQCGNDPDCARMIPLADSLERELEKAYPDEESREKPGDPDEPEAKTLPEATRQARARFAQARRDGASTK